MAFFWVSLFNGLSFGLLLFMLSAGLTLIFSIMGVLNFAHASFYMLGAYVGFSTAQVWGFWPALLVAPLLVGLGGAGFEKWCLRQVRPLGHVPELMVTFGLSYIVLELVQLVWGRSALAFQPAESLRGTAFTVVQQLDGSMAWVWGAAPPTACGLVQAMCSPFPATRAFVMVVALLVLVALWWFNSRTRWGLVVRAAITHPHTTAALGHNVPMVYTVVFGAGTGLAGLAGVVGGSTFVTEPAMAAALGPLIFVVVVVGGLGSLMGAFLTSVVLGLVQTFAVTMDHSWSQMAPVWPYLLLVGVLIVRPRGLLGNRES